jgi:hypothetical protein
VLGLGGKLDLADAREAAVDVLFAHQAFDRVDPCVEGAVEPVRDVPAELGGQHAVVLGEAVVAHAAVAAGRRVADGLRFKKHHARALLGQRQRGRTAGQAAADHCHVAVAVHGSFSGTAEGLRSVEPIRGQLHRGVPGAFERSISCLS